MSIGSKSIKADHGTGGTNTKDKQGVRIVSEGVPDALYRALDAAAE